MAGFANDVVFANNGDFSIAGSAKGQIANGLLTNGQMWIGSTSTNAGGTHINVGALTSPDSSITVGFSTPNITLQVTGGTSVGKTITGNTGTISPSGGNWNIVTANSTPIFAGSGSTLTLDFGLTNLFLGTSATSITTGNNNSFFGSSAGQSITTSGLNAGFGTGSLNVLSSKGSSNGENSAFGYATLSNLTSGTNNIAIGSSSGNNYTTSESSNILINNTGVLGESNVIRIGRAGSLAGQQNKAFLAGVTGVTVSASAPVAVDTNGQLSSLGFGTSTQVLTSNGAGASPTWQAAGGGGNAAGFSVYLSGNVSNVTGDGTNYTVIFDTKSLDTASAFNTGTGVYTFPYTGTWLLTGSFFLFNLGAAHTQLYAGITTTASSYNLYVANPYVMSAVGSTELQVPFTIIVQATATNTVYMTVEVVGGTKSVGLGGGSIGMSFSGVLLNT